MDEYTKGLNMTKAQQIIDALEREGITMYEVSQYTNISRPTLGNWKNGKIKKPHPYMIKILEQYADIRGVKYGE